MKEGKNVLITGASTGIGRALAIEFAKEDCKLILVARRLELMQEIKNELKIPEDKILLLKCDVTNKEEVRETYLKIKEKFGKIDIAVLNSGVGHSVTVENFNSKYADEIMGVNFLGMIYWIEQLLPGMLKEKKGIIAGVSSLADNRGFSGSGFYCASKAAASIYLEGLRVELKPHGIKVITIKPGFVRTPMTDKNNFEMPLLMEPDKAAKIIVSGIRKEKRVIQFPWQMVFLTRLVGLMPGNIYEFLASKVKTK